MFCGYSISPVLVQSATHLDFQKALSPEPSAAISVHDCGLVSSAQTEAGWHFSLQVCEWKRSVNSFMSISWKNYYIDEGNRDANCKLSYLGKALPLMSFFLKESTYWGNCTQRMSQSPASSTVQWYT